MLKPRFLPYGAVEIEKWRRVLRTTYLSFALRSCAPKCVKKMPGKPGDHQKSWKFLFSGHPKISTFFKLFEYFCLPIVELTSFLESSNDDWKWRNLQNKDKSQNWKRIHAKPSGCNVKCWNLGFCTSGPLK